LENPKENVCFSIRSFTDDYYEKGVLCRDIKNIITFRLCERTWYPYCEKFKNPALEDLQLVTLSKSDFDKSLQRQVVGVGKESAMMNMTELFASFGWSEKKKGLPAHSNW
jgi:hypothetical protein